MSRPFDAAGFCAYNYLGRLPERGPREGEP
jgi:hypothetical protein